MGKTANLMAVIKEARSKKIMGNNNAILEKRYSLLPVD